MGRFDWLFVLVVNFAIAIAIVFAVHSSGSLRLGATDAQPEFSRMSWFLPCCFRPAMPGDGAEGAVYLAHLNALMQMTEIFYRKLGLES